jgi:uncharacterized membrane protein
MRDNLREISKQCKEVDKELEKLERKILVGNIAFYVCGIASLVLIIVSLPLLNKKYIFTLVGIVLGLIALAFKFYVKSLKTRKRGYLNELTEMLRNIGKES